MRVRATSLRRVLPALVALGVIAAVAPATAMAATFDAGETRSATSPVATAPAGSLDVGGGEDFSGQNHAGRDFSGQTHHHSNFHGTTLHHAVMHHGVFHHSDFSGAVLHHAVMHHSVFHHSNFEHAVMHHVVAHHSDFSHSSMHHADLTGADLSSSDFTGVDMRSADLSPSQLHHARLDGVMMHRANLHGATLHHASMRGAKGHHVDFSGAVMHHTDLTKANFHHGNFSGAVMHHSKMSGFVAHHSNFVGADLRGSNLHGADLSHAAFGVSRHRSTRSGADVPLVTAGANLSGVNFSGASLVGSNFAGTSLAGANLSHANLFGANLRGADLSGADLSYARLANADLTGATTYGANLSNADFTGATVPSSADLNGLCMSLSGVNVPVGDMSVTFTRTASSLSGNSGTISLPGPNGMQLTGTYSCSMVTTFAGTGFSFKTTPTSWTISITGVSNTFAPPVPGLTVATGGVTGTIQKANAGSAIVWSLSMPFTLVKQYAGRAVTTTGTMSVKGSDWWQLTGDGGSVTFPQGPDGATLTLTGLTGSITYNGSWLHGSFTMYPTNSQAAEQAILSHLPAGWTAGTWFGITVDKSGGDTSATVGVIMNISMASSTGVDVVTYSGPWSPSGFTLNATGSLAFNGRSAPVTGTYNSAGVVVNATTLTQPQWSFNANIQYFHISKNWFIVSPTLGASNSSQGIIGTTALQPLASQAWALGVNVTFVSNTNWTITLNGNNWGPTWSPQTIPGLSIAGSGMSGTITRSGSATSWAISVASLTWNNAKTGIAMSTSASLTSDCPTSDCGSSSGPYFSITGASMTFPAPIGTVAVSGGLAVDGGWGYLIAQPGNLSVTGPAGGNLSLTGATVAIWMGAKPASATVGVTLPDITPLSDGIGVEFCGTFHVTIPNITTVGAAGCIDYNSAGIVIGQVGVGGSVPGATGSQFSSGATALTGWTWTSLTADNVSKLASTDVTLGDRTVTLASRTSVFTGNMSLPGVVMKALGQPMTDGTVPATLTFAYNGSWSDTDFSLVATANINYHAGTFTLNTVNFQVSKTGSHYALTWSAYASMYVDNKTYVLQLSLTAATGGGFMLAATVKGSGGSCGLTCDGVTSPLDHPQSGYNYLDDALFGVPGLHLWAVTISFSYVDGSPAVGFNSTSYLDPTAMPGFHGTTWLQSSTTANISYIYPCISLGFTSPDPNTYLQIKGGVFQTSTFQFAIAPRGCTVGAVTLPAGVSVNFVGAMGSNSSIAIAMFLGKDDSGKPMFTANVNVSNTTMMGITFVNMSLVMNLTTTSQTITYSGLYTLPIGTVYSAFDVTRNGAGHLQLTGNVCTGDDGRHSCPTGTQFGLQGGDLTVDYFSMDVSLDTTALDFDGYSAGRMHLKGKDIRYTGVVTIYSGHLTGFGFYFNYTHAGVTKVFTIGYMSDPQVHGLIGGLRWSFDDERSHQFTSGGHHYSRGFTVNLLLLFYMDINNPSSATLALGGALDASNVDGSFDCKINASGDDYCHASLDVHTSAGSFGDDWYWGDQPETPRARGNG